MCVRAAGTVTNPVGNLFTFQGATFNKTDTYQGAVGANYESGPLKLTVDVAHPDTTFKGSTESLDRIVGGAHTADFNLDRPSFIIRGVDLTNPASFRAAGLYEESQQASGKAAIILRNFGSIQRLPGRRLRSPDIII